MRFTSKMAEKGPVIELSDDLVAGSSDDLVLYVEEVLKTQCSGCQIFLDMNGANYIDSAGISALLRLHRAARNADGVLKLYGLAKNIEKILVVTRVNRILHIYKSFEEADSTDSDSAIVSEEPLEFRITIPGEYAYSKLAINFILRILRDHFDVEQNDELNIKISLEESITNSIEHGYKDFEKSGMVMAWVMIMGVFLIIVIDDQGQGFNRDMVLERMKQVPYNPFSDRGRGLFLINELMDDLSIDSSGKGSVFVMAKALKRKENNSDEISDSV